MNPTRILAGAVPRSLLVALLAGCGASLPGDDGGGPAGGSLPACAALDLSGTPVGSPPLLPGSGCARTSVGLVPLTDLGMGTYQGFEGGLYCGGSNTRPAGHEATGLALARSVGPMDASGQPDPGGLYAFVSIGMSNTTQEFSTFVPMANADPDRDPRLRVVDCAQGGQAADAWADPANACWATADARLATAGITPAQVAVAWVKLAERQPTQAFPADAFVLAGHISQTLANLRARYPNATLAYLSSRIYAGYATTTLNPEPYAYQSAFAVKKVVLDQVAGDAALLALPWVAWGPYLWADGTSPRGDGLTWACSDLQSDGTHPATTGREKVAQALLDFVRTDTTAREWYLVTP